MPIKQVFAELEALRTAGVVEDYALGGAVGAVRYIEPAATQDIDVFVVFRSDSVASLAPLGPAYDFLVRRGAKVEAEHLIIGDWPVQLLPAAGLLLEDAMKEARTENVDDQPVRILSAEHLAAIALDVGRPKDRIRLTQFLEWSGFDRARFEAIVKRTGLVAKWQQFKRLFLDEA